MQNSTPQFSSRPVWLSGAVAALLLTACSIPEESYSSSSSSPDASVTGDTDEPPAGDHEYCGSRVGWAERLLLRERLAPTGIDTFARLTAAQRQRLTQLLQRTEHRLEMLLAGPRLLVNLPDGHPAGPAELLLAADLGQAVLYLPSPRRRVTWSLQALPDLLDQSSRESARDNLELITAPIVEDTSEAEPAAAAKSPAEHLPGLSRRLLRKRGGVVIQYYAEPGSARGWSLRLQLEVLRSDDPPTVDPQPLLPLTLGLPLLAGDAGDHLLEALLDGGGTVTSWELRVTNESKPARPIHVRTRLEPRGWVRVPMTRFCTERQGYRSVSARRSVDAPGLAVLSAKELAGLRPAKSTGPLVVRNRSAHAAWIYADGVLLGWVGAGRRLELPGLPDGFYRIFARSPSAVRAWGPFDVYVPGPLTLW